MHDILLFNYVKERHIHTTTAIFTISIFIFITFLLWCNLAHHDIYDKIKQVTCPVYVLAQQSVETPHYTALAHQFPHGHFHVRYYLLLLQYASVSNFYAHSFLIITVCFMMFSYLVLHLDRLSTDHTFGLWKSREISPHMCTSTFRLSNHNKLPQSSRSMPVCPSRLLIDYNLV